MHVYFEYPRHSFSDLNKGWGWVFQPFIEANWLHNSKDFGSNLDGISIKQDGTANITELEVGSRRATQQAGESVE